MSANISLSVVRQPKFRDRSQNVCVPLLFVSRAASSQTLIGSIYLMIRFGHTSDSRYELNSQGSANKWFSHIHEKLPVDRNYEINFGRAKKQMQEHTAATRYRIALLEPFWFSQAQGHYLINLTCIP